MKRLITSILVFALFVSVYAQDTEDSKKEKKEKAAKEAKSKDDSSKKADDADVFIGEPEGDNYQLEERREVSKPEMPSYDVSQGFNSQKKKGKQQEAYMNKEYYYPAKPKNAWQIGLTGGLAGVNGDVNQNFFKGNKPFAPGYTFGAYVKKPFSYMFSMRMKYSFLEFWNTDWDPSTLTNDQITHTKATTGNPNAFAGYSGGDRIFQNAHTVGHDLTLDAIVSFGNVRFHKERTKVVFNVFLTGGAMMFRTWYDLYDDNGNPYDYSSILNTDFDNLSKKDVIKELNSLRNRVYETEADRPTKAETPRILGYSVTPVFGFGTGLTFRLNRIMDLDVSGRMMFSRNDLLDGLQFQEPELNSNVPDSRGLTREFDSYYATEVGLNFKLVGKKKTEPLTLLNPMQYTYEKMASLDPEAAIDDLLKDDDEDGVPNRLDQEANTPKGAPVNPKGIALDSDADGIIDLNDDEPFSPPGVPVNAKGVANVPPSCCESLDLSKLGGSGVDCDADIAFPSIHFDKDKYYIKPEFYAHLHEVADRMIACPDLKIKATGMADKDDNTKYNEQLSWNRVNAVVDYLNSHYGIDRNRFVVDYKGESNANATTSAGQYQERKVTMEITNESGSSNPAAPHPSIKAGSDK